MDEDSAYLDEKTQIHPLNFGILKGTRFAQPSPLIQRAPQMAGDTDEVRASITPRSTQRHQESF